MIVRLRRALRAQIVPLFAGFALLTGVFAGRSLLTENQLAHNQAAWSAMEFTRLLGTVFSLVQDAETGQRGYLITNDQIYLAPYRKAVAALPTELERLRDAAQGSDRRRVQTDYMEADVSTKLSELGDVLRLWDEGNRDGAMAVIRSERGKVAMDRLRETVNVAMRDEGAEIQARLEKARSSEEWLRIASVAALLLVLTMAALGLWTARLGYRAVEAAQRRLEQSNEELRQAIVTRDAAEGQVRQMQKMDAIGQFTGGIAHDFNNMLAVVMSAMSLAQRKLARGDTDVGKFVDAAVDAADRAAKLTARLLAFARQQPLSPQVLDCNRLVAGMSDLLRRTLGENVQVETVLAGGLWKVHADSSQLENALINLAVNARDAMPEGGKLTIETVNAHLDEAYAETNPGAEPGQYVLIAVTDTGTGMSSEVMARAFDPFFTTKPVSKGTGLGLSQVFGFIKQSSGHIKIYSELGEGTTIKIYLPRQMREEEVGAAVARPVNPGNPTETVLLVEDDDRVRSASAEALAELGYTVIPAASGAEALALLDERDDIALLFTDIVMPGMSGKKLADEAVQRRPGLRVVYTTGFTRNAIIHNGVLDRGVNFLAKPFTLEQLAAKLREVLDA